MRTVRRVVTVAMLAALSLPLFAVGDGVPLSSYPMYASPRAEVVEFVVVSGLDQRDEAVALSTVLIADTNDPLVAESYLRREIAGGRADTLCREVARRIELSGLDEVVRVAVRTEEHSVVDRARGLDSMIASDAVTECAVG